MPRRRRTTTRRPRRPPAVGTTVNTRPSSLETLFLETWLHFAPAHLPLPVRELVFAHGRGWRWDFAWAAEQVAVEVHGMTYTGGRHVRGAGIRADAEKHNAGVMLGWAVLVYTGDMLTDNPVNCINEVARLVAARTQELY